MIKKIIKSSAITFLTIMLCSLIGFFLLFVVNCLPSGRVAANVRRSGVTLMEEGDYYSIIPTDSSSILDNFTDSIMLLTTGYTGKRSAWEETIYAYRIYGKKMSKEESCTHCGDLPEEKQKELDYTQYWHGYKLILKPLLAFWDLAGIRQLNTMLIFSLLTAIVLLMNKRKLMLAIPGLLCSFCFLNIGVVAMSLQYSNIFHITSFAIIALLALWNQKIFQSNIWLYFLLTGIVTSYFDFLTYPITTLIFPLIIYTMLMSKEEHLFKGILVLTPAINAILYSFIWCVGYAGMWAMKWILASVFTGKNQITYALSKVQERGGNTFGDAQITFGNVIEIMKPYLSLNQMKTVCILIAAILIICAVISKGFLSLQRIVYSFVIFVIAFYPFIWYFFTKNHSYQHNFFTFRTMCGFLFGISTFVIPMINTDSSN